MKSNYRHASYQIFVVAAIGIMAAACQGKAPAIAANDTVQKSTITTGVGLTPALAAIDSIDVLFYKDPFGKDGKRYTRYYSSFHSATDRLIELVKSNMEKPFVEDTLRSCRSEGKIFCFSKGRVVQTIYFTNQNEHCTHLYFINTGRYYYFKPDSAFTARLYSIKPNAK